MNEDYRGSRARRVIVGVGADGRSAVLDDALATQRVSAPAFVINDVWESPAFPVPMTTPAPNGAVSITPPAAGLVIRICTFPPDDAYDHADYQASLEALQGGDTHRPDAAVAGMHETLSLDVVTVVSGELYIILEAGETLLRQGDCVVMKGGSHTWSNRTKENAVLCSVIMSSVEC